MRNRLALAVLCWLMAGVPARAGQPQLEFWPEVDAWWRVSPSARLALLVPISKNVETEYREGNLILQGDYAWGGTHFRHQRRLLDENRAQHMKRMLVRGGYLGGKSLGDKGDAYTLNVILHLYFETGRARTPPPPPADPGHS
jgi:hypothetical protein